LAFASLSGPIPLPDLLIVKQFFHTLLPPGEGEVLRGMKRGDKNLDIQID
jgi:hypothetical protein